MRTIGRLGRPERGSIELSLSSRVFAQADQPSLAKLRRSWKITSVPRSPATPVPRSRACRDFTVCRRNQLWVAGITYVRAMVSLFYLAMVLDLFVAALHRVDGESDSLRTQLVLAVLEMAVHHRDTGSFAVHPANQPPSSGYCRLRLVCGGTFTIVKSARR